jgi:hypothetical protein
LLLLFPRLLLIAFIFAQPFLITAILELLYKPDDKNFRVERLELIFATGFIYMGISVRSIRYILSFTWTLTRAGPIFA